MVRESTIRRDGLNTTLVLLKGESEISSILMRVFVMVVPSWSWMRYEVPAGLDVAVTMMNGDERHNGFVAIVVIFIITVCA